MLDILTMEVVLRASIFMFSKNLLLPTFLFFFTLFFPIRVSAALWINEIYPAPVSGDEEWVELYNDQPLSVDISTLTLTDATNKIITFSDKIIKPFGYTIATSAAVLNNSGPETVSLKDLLSNIIDSVTYTDTFTSTKSYIRCPDGGNTFFVSTIITREYTNSGACDILLAPTPTATPTATPTPTNTPTPTVTPTPTLAPVSYNNIYISEVMIDPDDDQDEWIEIYNDNEYTVTLTDWYIDDTADSGSSPRKFTLTIGSKSYGVVDITSSVFNNSGDTVRILDASNSQKDSYEYTDSSKGKSQGRMSLPAGSFCEQEPTKGSVNAACITQSETTSSASSSNSISSTKKLKSTPLSTLNPDYKPVLYPQQSSTKKIVAPPKTSIGLNKNGDVLGASDTIVKGESTSSELAVSRSLAFAACSYAVLLLVWIIVKQQIV